MRAYTCTAILALCLVLESSSFSTQSRSLIQSKTLASVRPQNRCAAAAATRPSLNTKLHSTGGNNAINEIRDDDEGILPAAVAVGAITATIGYLYGKALSNSVKLLWTALPNALIARNIVTNPIYFITGMCTLGGLLVAILSEKFKLNFTVADFVSAFSSATPKPQDLPQSRSSLLPLLLLSLITSAFGFSLGPEAPMVCAGGVAGASLARKIYKDDCSDKKMATLAYSGAAGCLTAFMGIPIAGSVFALELTRSSAGMSGGTRDAFSPAIAASLAGLVVLRGFLAPNVFVGGHFNYGLVGSIGGRTMISLAIASGLGGGLLGTLFHKMVDWFKKVFWSSPKGGKALSKKRKILVKVLVGLVVGLLSSQYPQTLFWGEGSLQLAIDGQQTAFEATHHALPKLLTSVARVDPSVPFTSASSALQIGLAKLLAITLACAGKFPGGIIFPLFFAAAPFAHAFASLLGPSLLPIVVMCLMSSTQAAVTRTPLGSALILSLTSSGATELSTMLPACLVASYVGVWASQWLSSKSYFQYSEKTD